MRRTLTLTTLLFALPCASLLQGCGRTGLGLAPGRLYENSVGPVTARRPDFRRGEFSVKIPERLIQHEATAHQISLSIPLLFPPGPPGTGQLFTIAWGDISQQKVLRQGGMPEVVFADARTLSILGLYTRTIIISYADADADPNAPFDGPIWTAEDRRSTQ